MLFELKVFQWRLRTQIAQLDHQLDHFVKRCRSRMMYDAQNLLQNGSRRVPRQFIANTTNPWFKHPAITSYRTLFRQFQHLSRIKLEQARFAFRRQNYYLMPSSHWSPFTVSHPGTFIIIGLNCLVFSAWKLATPPRHGFDFHYSRSHSVGLSTTTMYRHFTTSWYAITKGYWHTPVLATISHSDNKHFFYNVITGFFMGRSLETLIGGKQLLLVYFGAGIVAAVVQAWHEKRKRPGIPICGASGAVAAIMAILAIRIPFSLIYLYGIIPVPMIALVGACLAYDMFSSGALDGVGHEAHVAGTLMGSLFHFVLRH